MNHVSLEGVYIRISALFIYYGSSLGKRDPREDRIYGELQEEKEKIEREGERESV